MVLKVAFMQQCRDAVGLLGLFKQQSMDEEIADCEHVLPEEKVFCRVFLLTWPEILTHINALRVQVV